MIMVVMGVCGCGKTTVGKALSEKLEGTFIDADDLHPAGNKAKMSQGIALTDADRIPWLLSVRVTAVSAAAEGRPVIVACSALKASYRLILTGGEPAEGTVMPISQYTTTVAAAAVNGDGHNMRSVIFVHLDGSFDVIKSRMAARFDHFMPASLLESQFAALEPPAASENYIRVSIEGTCDDIVARILKQMTARSLATVARS